MICDACPVHPCASASEAHPGRDDTRTPWPHPVNIRLITTTCNVTYGTRIYTGFYLWSDARAPYILVVQKE